MQKIASNLVISVFSSDYHAISVKTEKNQQDTKFKYRLHLTNCISSDECNKSDYLCAFLKEV